MEFATGYPGYDSLMGKDTATVAEILRKKGWNTAWFGKNHNVPDWQTSQAGPFDLWPTGLGFEKFYGFIGGETSQWRPAAFDGTKPIEPYLGNPDYNFDYDIADQAIEWVRSQKAVAPNKPFFLYYAPGATHSPHHPKKEWIVKYKGRFDQGWDQGREETLARQKKQGLVPANTKLSERTRGIPAWDSLNAEQKQLYAYMMEIYAGYLSQTDYNVGRVLDAIQQYFEVFAFRGIYHDGWIACVTPPNATWEDQTKFVRPDVISGVKWELYHVAEDFSEDYDVPFRFTGKIEKVVVKLGESKLGAVDQKTLKEADARRRADE